MSPPHFFWGDSIDLPWRLEYRIACDDGKGFRHRPIREEALGIAQELAKIASSDDGDPWAQVTYLSAKLSSSEKLMMQGLATEALLSVEGFLSHVSGGFLPESVCWLAAAYKNIIECTGHAQRILGYASENAKKAAHARHRENREMKAQVCHWYSRHKDAFPSMDKAAEAVVGSIRLVPVSFRTARAWIGEWVRHQQSARKP